MPLGALSPAPLQIIQLHTHDSYYTARIPQGDDFYSNPSHNFMSQLRSAGWSSVLREAALADLAICRVEPCFPDCILSSQESVSQCVLDLREPNRQLLKPEPTTGEKKSGIKWDLALLEESGSLLGWGSEITLHPALLTSGCLASSSFLCY